ncbi:MAG TPA: glycosyltransferase family 39 protein [Candidatus Brocadiia bacterium]|nr:glycosyltransferase family 39 protein [Candidatus Brocadiia bacterium]
MAIITAAIIVRMVCAVGTKCVSKDAVVHIEMAEAWDEGRRDEVLARQHHVFYPILLSYFRGEHGDWISAGQRLDLLASFLALFPLMLLARRIGGDGVAAVAGLLYAVHPYSARYGADVLTEPVYSLFFVSGAAAGLAALQTRRAAMFAVTGIFGGLAYLIRPEGMSVILVVSLWGFISYVLESYSARRPGTGPKPERAISFAGWTLRGVLLLGGFAICAFPYIKALHEVRGVWMLTPKKDMSELLVEKPPSSTEATILFPEKDKSGGEKKSEEKQPESGIEGDSQGPDAHANVATAGFLPVQAARAEWLGSRRLDSLLAVPAMFSKAMPDLFMPLVVLGLIWRDWKRRSAKNLTASLAIWTGYDGGGASCRAPVNDVAPAFERHAPLFSGEELYVLTYAALFSLIFFRLHYAAGYLSGRHAYPVALLCLPWAGIACVKIGDWAEKMIVWPGFRYRVYEMFTHESTGNDEEAGGRLMPIIYSAFTAIAFAIAVLPKTLEEQKSKDLSEVRAGRRIISLWILDSLPMFDRIRVLNPGNPRIALYAQAESVDVVEACRRFKKPCSSPEQFKTLIPELMFLTHSQYFAFVVEELDRFLPGLLQQLDSGQVPELVLVHTEPSHYPKSPHSVRIYRLSNGAASPRESRQIEGSSPSDSMK